VSVGRLDRRPVESIRARHTQSELQTGLPQVSTGYGHGGTTANRSCRRRWPAAPTAQQRCHLRLQPSSSVRSSDIVFPSSANVDTTAAAADRGRSAVFAAATVTVGGSRPDDSTAADSALTPPPPQQPSSDSAVVGRRSLAGGYRQAD